MKASARTPIRTLVPTLLLLLFCVSNASAEVDFSSHTGLRLGLDAGIGTGIRYQREPGFGGPKLTPDLSGQLDLSLHYVFENPVGVGAHVGAALVPIGNGVLSGSMQVIDLGPSLLLRLPISSVELSLRFPFGLSLGGASFASRTLELEGVLVRSSVGSNELGVGAHAGGLLGAQVWVSEHWALRFETGAFWRSVYRDEFFSLAAKGAPFVLPSATQTNVRHDLLTWTITLGLQWGKRP